MRDPQLQELLDLAREGAPVAEEAEQLARELGDRIAVLLAIIAGGPEGHAWDHLIDEIDEIVAEGEGSLVGDATAELSAQLQGWPDEERMAPEHWWNATQSGDPTYAAVWPLVRSLSAWGSDTEVVACSVGTALATLTELTAQSRYVDAQYLRDATSLKGLTYEFVDGYGEPITSANLEPLGFLEGLLRLDLRLMRPNSIAPLAHLRSLEQLDLTVVMTSGSEPTLLDGLANLSRLRRLVLEARVGRFSNLGLVGNLDGLRSLTLAFPPEDLTPIARLTSLESLEIRNAAQWDPGAAARVIPASLTSLRIDDTDLDSIGELAHLVRLEHLELTSAGQLTGLDGGPRSLQKLLVRDSATTAIGHLEAYPALRELYLFSNPGFDTLQLNGQHAQMRRLSIARSPLLVDIGAAAGMTKLQRLLLTEVGLGNLDSLAGHGSLEEVVLESCGYLTSVAALASIRSLRRVYISDCPGVGDVESIQRRQDLTVQVEA